MGEFDLPSDINTPISIKIKGGEKELKIIKQICFGLKHLTNDHNKDLSIYDKSMTKIGRLHLGTEIICIEEIYSNLLCILLKRSTLIKLYDISNLTLLRTFNPTNEKLNTFCVLNKDHLMIPDSAGEILILNLISGKIVNRLKTEKVNICRMKITRSWLIISTKNGEISAFKFHLERRNDFSNNCSIELFKVLSWCTTKVIEIIELPDESSFAVIFDSSAISIMNLKSERYTGFSAQDSKIIAVCYVKKYDVLITLSENELKFWSIASNQQIYEITPSIFDRKSFKSMYLS